MGRQQYPTIYDPYRFNWFGAYFNGYEKHSRSTGQVIKFKSKIQEKTDGTPTCPFDPRTATAVFAADRYCTRSKGVVEVIVKVFMQIPNILGIPGYPHSRSEHSSLFGQADFPHNPDDFAEQASSDNHSFHCELDTLEYLTAQSSSCTPVLYEYFMEAQGSDLWVTGGFLHMIVMEKLPGKTICEIWGDRVNPPKDQTLIVHAFKECLLEMYQLGVWHGDRRAENMLWDSESNKCYMIDFEMAYREDPYVGDWESNPEASYLADHLLLEWGLWDSALKEICEVKKKQYLDRKRVTIHEYMMQKQIRPQ